MHHIMQTEHIYLIAHNIHTCIYTFKRWANGGGTHRLEVVVYPQPQL